MNSYWLLNCYMYCTCIVHALSSPVPCWFSLCKIICIIMLKRILGSYLELSYWFNKTCNYLKINARCKCILTDTFIHLTTWYKLEAPNQNGISTRLFFKQYNLHGQHNHGRSCLPVKLSVQENYWLIFCIYVVK